MTDSKKQIDTKELAIHIINNEEKIFEYDVAPKGQYFVSHTEAFREMGIYHNCVSYIKYYDDDGNPFIRRAAHRNLLKMLSAMDKDGIIDIGKARGIVEKDRCNKCYGKGFIRGYEHVHNGVCFKCGGTGIA